MKKRLLSLLLSVCCVGGSLIPALAVDATASTEVTDPTLVLPYCESEDPLSAKDHTRSADSASSDNTIFEKIYGSSKSSRYSGFTNKTYTIPSGYNVYDGIDVSKWDGNINWTKVSNDGVDFAFIRVGYRGTSNGALYQDPNFTTYMQNAASAHIPVGVYVFSQALTQAEAQAEANFALERVAAYNIQLPIVMDYEYYNGTGRLDTAHLSRSQKTQNVLAFCETIRAAGYQPMVYANKSFLTDDLYMDQVNSAAHIWLANYTTNTTYSGSYDFWQYAENGYVSGINTEVDCNFFFTTGSLVSDDYICGFKDVFSSQWYADAVSFAYNNGLMSGTSATTFRPNDSMTRTMMAQILYNFCGKPAVTYSNIYSDVPAGTWYTNAVIWAAENNIMAGYGNGKFGVNDVISREQIATVLYNFSNQNDLETSSRDDLNNYSDASSISNYAVEPMQWAVSTNILSGRSTTTLAPLSNATRAECAQIFKNYLTGIASSLMDA
ncbi:MAG: S-layer homology domain-containing protein [Clostridia bacterium]|nr:S-layer homology domain-containing protein [Clostridia bacterium]